MHLLSHESSNAKLSKNGDKAWVSYILYLAPADTVSGLNLCSASSPGCRAACLYTAGRGQMNSVREARVRKTELYRDNRPAFMSMLVADLEIALRRALKRGLKLAVRLNGTSDIDWENIPCFRRGSVWDSIMEAFPTIQFYDYTKRPDRAKRSLDYQWPSNYRLTFSRSDANEGITWRLANLGCNVAVVFANELPDTWMGRQVIDGTKSDMRWLDPQGVVVGLVAKGLAKRDTSGFVLNYSDIAAALPLQARGTP